MYYVYILKHPTEDRIYIGFSTDLRERMKLSQERTSELAIGLLRSLRFRKRRKSARAPVEAVWERSAITEETNHG